MNNIYITENISDMISIGRELANAKSQIYNQWGGVIYDVIKRNFPSITKEEADNLYYRSIYDYWVYGSRIDEWFLYKFFGKSHQEKDEYVTTRRKFQYVNYLNNKNDRYLLDNKYETYKLLRPYFKRDAVFLKDESDYGLFLDYVKKHPVCVVKPTDATYGQGVYRLSVDLNDNLKSVFDSLFSKNNSTHRDSLVDSNGVLLEELIIQDDRIAALHPNSVQCLRCNTLLVDGKAKVFATSMKVGVGNQFVTSISGGSLTVGINREEGVMETGGFSEIFGIDEVFVHPNSGITFKGFQVPCWKEMLSFVKEIAEQVPSIGYIAWDLALTSEGWCVIEGNYAGEFFGMQLPYHRGIKPRLEKELGWKPDYYFWWQE